MCLETKKKAKAKCKGDYRDLRKNARKLRASKNQQLFFRNKNLRNLKEFQKLI